MVVILSLLWSDHWCLGAKTNIAGVGALEDAGIAVAAQVSPLGLADVAHRMHSLVAAVELVSELIEDSRNVDVEEIYVNICVSRAVGSNLVPQNLVFIFAIETKILFALGHPWVER